MGELARWWPGAAPWEWLRRPTAEVLAWIEAMRANRRDDEGRELELRAAAGNMRLDEDGLRRVMDTLKEPETEEQRRLQAQVDALMRGTG